MSHPSRKLFLVMLAIFALAMSLSLTACSDDDDPTVPGGGGETPEGDTTAPVLITSDPDPESTNLEVNRTISAFFSEPLDFDSLAGNITLSTGTITDLVLVGGNEVEIRHEDWNPGDMVTATFAVGISDTSGNNMAEEVSYRYWVDSDDVLVLETTPADEAVDVLRNAPVSIKFNKQMSVASLATGISATIPGKGALTFTIDSQGNNVYNVVFDDTIPEDTHVMIVVSTDCQSWNDGVLTEEYSFSYDTGADLDETAPELVGFTPASGTVIDPSTSALQIEFSEPVGDEHLEVIRIDLLTILGMELADMEGSWNVDKTVMTFTLGGPLQAGVEMTLQLGDFSDQAGNVNSSNPTWNVTVAGTADHYPVDDTFVYIFENFVEDSDGDVYDYTEAFHLEWGTGENFRRKEFDFDLEVWNEWENLIRTSSAIQLNGFREFRGGVGEDVVFDNPVQILNHPTVTASWTGSVEVTTGDGVMNVEFDGEVLPDVSDFPTFFGRKSGLLAGTKFANTAKVVQLDVFWPNCRSVVEEIEGSVSGDLMFTETDTLVYCPGFGLIKEMSLEIQHDDGRESHRISNLYSLELFDDN